MYLRGSGNRSFSTAANWADAVDHAAGTGRVPLPQDSATVDSTTGNGVITLDVPRVGPLSLWREGGSNYIAGSGTIYVYGSLTLDVDNWADAPTPSFALYGRSNCTLSSVHNLEANSITIHTLSATCTLQSNISANGSFTVSSGVFDANDYSITASYLYSQSGYTRTIYMGSGTWTSISYYALHFDSSGLTLYCETSTVSINSTTTSTVYHAYFDGLTFYNITVSGDGTWDRKLMEGFTCTGTFTVSAGSSIRFESGKTFTAAAWALNGTASSGITIYGDGAACTFAKSGGGTVTAKCCTITNITASPASTFTGENCTNVSGNTNWTWTSARYLVATGNWSSTGTWSLSDGGASGAAVPTSSDDTYCTALSGAVTLTVSDSSCKDFVCTGFTGTVTGQYLYVYGATCTLPAGMTASNLGLRPAITSGTQALTVSVPIANLVFSNTATVQAQTDISCLTIQRLAAGTFDANGKKVTLTSANAYLRGFTGSSSLYDLDVIPTTPAADQSFGLYQSSLTVTHNLTFNGGATYRLYVGNNYSLSNQVRGGAITITCNGTVTVSGAGVDYEDITGAGTASWDQTASAKIGDCGGNSGITFTTPGTQYLKGSGNRSFSTAANWADADDHLAGTGRVPLPQDTAYLNGNTGSGTITQDLVRIGALNCTGHTGTLAPSAASLFGSWVLSSGQTIGNSGTMTLAGHANLTFTSNTKALRAQMVCAVAPGYKWSMVDALDLSGAGASGVLTCTSGTFDFNGQNGNISRFAGVAAGAGLRLGDGCTLTIYGGSGGVPWNGTQVAIDAGESTVDLNFASATSAACAFGGETFYNLKIRGSYVGTRSLSGGVTVLNELTLATNTYTFYRGTTYTAKTWIIENGCTLSSDTTSAATIAKSGGGTVRMEYCTISYLTGSPVNTFYAYNSTNGGNNTNIYFMTERSSSLNLDVIVAAPQTGQFNLDAVVARQVSGTFLLDTLVARPTTGTFSLDVYVRKEEITTPGTPSTTTPAELDDELTFTTTGATTNFSDLGHTLEYQWTWGDGFTSDWGTSLSATHRYTATGTYSVTVTARCAQDTSRSATSAALALTIAGGVRDIVWSCDKIIAVLRAGLTPQLAVLDAEYNDGVTLETVDTTNYHISEQSNPDGYPLVCVVPDRVDCMEDSGEYRHNLEHHYITVSVLLTGNSGEDELKRRCLRTIRAIEDVLIADSTLGGQVVDCLPLDKAYAAFLLDEDALIDEAQLNVRVTVLSEE